MNPVAFSISVGTFGAILQELLFWYNAKTKLETKEYKDILTSKSYWIVVSAMAIGSGIASYFWFLPEHQTARTYLLFGAAFPALFKKAVDAFISKQDHLGLETEEAKPSVLRNYFSAA
jgi:uncharacterized BrkB/YihY/UPF0761 family membrane protein